MRGFLEMARDVLEPLRDVPGSLGGVLVGPGQSYWSSRTPVRGGSLLKIWLGVGCLGRMSPYNGLRRKDANGHDLSVLGWRRAES